MHPTRPARILLLLGLLLAGTAAPVADARAAGAAPDEACFPETGFCVQGRFLAYWQAHGGLALNGYPLTAERQERLEDGNTYTVQYFERVRMEYHPENADPQYQVLLGQFGRRIHPTDPPTQPIRGATYFPETGHNLSDYTAPSEHEAKFYTGFLAYWQQHGGLAQFGYPLSELRIERLEDGREHEVQYFERGRFELHGNDQVLLGQLGRRILAEVDAGR